MSFKIYAENLEQSTLAQWEQVIETPWVVAGALMPDAHTGYVMPIGGVVVTKDVISPAFIGYDIGCGVLAACLPITDIQNRQELYDLIKTTVPLGFNTHKTPQAVPEELPYTNVVAEALKRSGYNSMGTLGGGNHFIEIGISNESVWVVIHSGSRNLGHSVASHYMNLATRSVDAVTQITADFYKTPLAATLSAHNPDKLPEAVRKYVDKQLSRINPEGIFGLKIGTADARDYLIDMEYCLEYAKANRLAILGSVIECIKQVEDFPALEVPPMLVNKNHNHAELLEIRDGHSYYIHRKGATSSNSGELGVIPGSMKSGSFIVQGKGNAAWLSSSSHGAGRVLGRKQAKRTLLLEDFQKTMTGIVAGVDQSSIDEAPAAYKDIEEVMDLQADSVQVLHHIKPIINIKG